MKKYITPSSRVSLLRASSLCLMLAGPSVALAADDSNQAEISASVSVVATEICKIIVLPSGRNMAMTWTRDTEGVSSATLVSPTDPIYVTVKSLGGENCNVNNLTLRTKIGDGLEQMVSDSGITYYRSKVNNQGAFWRILPYLADAKFYLDDSVNSEGSGKISWDGPTSGDGDTVSFLHEPKNKASDTIESSAGAGKFMFMTDEYVEDGGALLVDGANSEGHFSSDKQDEQYKSARLGFGALIATDPENADGVPNPQIASGGDLVTFSWVVYIDQA